MKHSDPDAVAKNPFVRALANLPAFLVSSVMGKLRRATAGFISVPKEERTSESLAHGENAKAELLAIRNATALSAEAIGDLSRAAESLASEAREASENRSVSDWVVQADPDTVAKKISDSFLLGLSEGVLTESGYALRKYADVAKAGKSESYSVPFSKDYRGIVYGGKLVAVTTWTPYRAVAQELASGEFELSSYALPAEVLTEAQRVAEAFSREAGFQSFTLDFLLPEDGMPLFHETNRLEFSSMSHPAVRALVAYLRYCEISGFPGSDGCFRDFVSGFRDDREKFTELFYGRMLRFFRDITERNPKFAPLLAIHEKTITEEYAAFRDYAPVWCIWDSGCGNVCENGGNGYNVAD